jgi:hypothetical protein
MHVLPVTSRSLARGVDGIYRDGSSCLVRTQLTSGLLPIDVLSSFSESTYDAFGSSEISSYERAAYERAARLYSETAARKSTDQKSNTFVVIVSLCVVSMTPTIWTLF